MLETSNKRRVSVFGNNIISYKEVTNKCVFLYAKIKFLRRPQAPEVEINEFLSGKYRYDTSSGDLTQALNLLSFNFVNKKSED